MATLDSLNLDKNLYRILPTESDNLFAISPYEQKSMNDIASEGITSGELLGDISMVDGFLQSKNFVSGSTGWKLNNDGIIYATGAEISGTITATAGEIGGWTINTTSIYTGTEDHSGYTANAGDMTIYSSGTDASIHAKNFYIDTSGNLTCQSATIAGSTISTPTITGIQSGSEIAIQGWQQDMAFSASDYRVVAWASGTITLLDGTTYSITGANTGNMAALTYIYLDIGTSTTLLQTTTTASTAVGSGKILIAVAENNSDTSSKATFQVFGGKGGNLLAVDNIAANSASTNEFISNTAQIKNAIITDAKIDTLSANKIIAGSGIINALSVLTTLTMGSAGTDGTIQSYGWDGSVNGFQILGGGTPAISIIGGTIKGGSLNINDNAIIDTSGNMTVTSLKRNDFHWFTTFESVDGYSKITDGTGTVTATADGVVVATGNVTDNDTEIKKSLGDEISWDKNSKFKCEIIPANDEFQRIEIGIGTPGDYPHVAKHYSFFINGSDIYSLIADGSNEYETELQGITAGSTYLLEAALDVATGLVKFYINNSLVLTSDGDGTPAGDSSYSFYIRARTKENAVKTITMKWWDFWQAI